VAALTVVCISTYSPGAFAEELAVPIPQEDTPEAAPAISGVDILGIYPGMSRAKMLEIVVKEFATNQTQNWPLNSDYKIGGEEIRLTTGPIPWRVYGSNYTANQAIGSSIVVGLSAPFSGSRVLGIERSLFFSQKDDMSIEKFMDILVKKYGTPSRVENSSNQMEICWGYKGVDLLNSAKCPSLNYMFEYYKEPIRYDPYELTLSLQVSIEKIARDLSLVGLARFKMVGIDFYRADKIKYDALFDAQAKRLESAKQKTSTNPPKL
jgi:hypothetical protein